MYDYNSVEETDGETYLSQKDQREYDCKEEQERLLFYSMHSENMGRGNTVHAANTINKDWRPVAPGSVGEFSWQFACGK